MWRVFQGGRDSQAPMLVAERGGRALQIVEVGPRKMGFLFDQDADRLMETAGFLKAARIVAQAGQPEQHLHLEGESLRSALKIAALSAAARGES